MHLIVCDREKCGQKALNAVLHLRIITVADTLGSSDKRKPILTVLGVIGQIVCRNIIVHFVRRNHKHMMLKNIHEVFIVVQLREDRVLKAVRAVLFRNLVLKFGIVVPGGIDFIPNAV